MSLSHRRLEGFAGDGTVLHVARGKAKAKTGSKDFMLAAVSLCIRQNWSLELKKAHQPIEIELFPEHGVRAYWPKVF